MGKEIEFTEGVVWEEGPWKILFDYEHEYGIDKKMPCKHCRDEICGIVHGEASKYTRKACTVPRVVVAVNEGGFNSTGVCMDCILEAAASIEGE